MGDGQFDVETGVPVAKTIDGNATVQPSELPGGTVATTVHIGPYDGLGAAHEALQAWAREHDKTPAGGPWESYVTGPGRESDPSKYKTILYLPLEDDDVPESN
jgi:effector-binding domain-containing protein